LNNRRMGYGVVAGVLAGTMVMVQSTAALAQANPAKPAPGATAAKAPDLAAAKRHYADAEKKYKAGDFVGALADFKMANDIKGTPQAERYIGLCEDSLGHYRAAAESYELFLAHVPEKMSAQGEEIKKRLSDIKAIPGKVHVESNPSGASVTVDGKPQTGPTPVDVDLSPGAHVIKLAASGRLPAEKQVDVAFASTQTVSADLEREPMPPPPPPAPPIAAGLPPPPPEAPPPPEPRSNVPAYVTGALAIAAAGVGTVFGVIALNDKSDFDKNPTTKTADDGDTHSLIADMAFGVAITFGVTSAVLFLTKDEASATPNPGSTAKKIAPRTAGSGRDQITFVPTPLVGPHSGGAGFLLRF
jgi:hypothetical protein